ncbi:hypothetical protein B4113_3440 [Geobacillus sp. B4113_201601]|nr:hypothetical protein B4113_3440 [Geobacillus sp. B4113_201601]
MPGDENHDPSTRRFYGNDRWQGMCPPKSPLANAIFTER